MHMRKLLPWTPQDEQQQQNRLEAIKSVFNRDYIHAISCKGNSPATPILITSMPRAGSTLLETILASHSAVTPCGETGSFPEAIDTVAVQHNLGAHIWEWGNSTTFHEYLKKITSVNNTLLVDFNITTKFYSDKSMYNTALLGLYLAAYPNAIAIDCVRHPLDVCLSAYQIKFGDGNAYTYNLESMARSYLRHQDFMAHWKSIFPDRIHTVQYEDLVKNQGECTEQLLLFCGLPWERSCLEFHSSRMTVTTASAQQVRQPIYRTSIDRWKNYREELIPAAAILNIDIDKL